MVGAIEPAAPPSTPVGTPGTPGIVVVDVVVVGWAARCSLVGGRISLPSPVSQAAATVTRADAATAARNGDDRRSTPGQAR